MSSSPVAIRIALEDDLPAIVEILASDTVGGHGDTTDPKVTSDYQAAFARISDSSWEDLYVATRDGRVVGTFQTLVTTTLSGRGSSAMIVEAVHTHPDVRGQGIGAEMIGFAIETAREQGLAQVQLTSNAKRTDAHRFYERLGFARSHFGFKMKFK